MNELEIARLKGEEAAVGEIQKIVDRFNEDFSKWRDRTGMVASFQWRYGDDGYDQPGKELALQSIDRIVFRRTAPSPQTLAQALSPRDDG